MNAGTSNGAAHGGTATRAASPTAASADMGDHGARGGAAVEAPATRADAARRESTGRARISACIVAFQEADRIGPCLESLSFCDEILVVDSHSTDRTRELAAEHDARVIERDWPGHVAQKEFAVRAAKHDWVLCVDADERVSDGLRDEICALRDAGFFGHSGWEMPRCSRYLGRWIRHGTWYPDLSLRLFDRRRGHWGGNDPHDHVQLDSAPGRLRNELLHEPYRSIDDHLATIASYTTIMADGMAARGRRASVLDMIVRPTARFFVFYVWKRGFLDGWRGFVLAVLATYYVFLKYAKLVARQRA